MSLLIINGASAGGFSPISIFGAITNGVVARNGLPGSPLGLFVASYVFNTLLSIGVFLCSAAGSSCIGEPRVSSTRRHARTS
jgi:hypothetical protein